MPSSVLEAALAWLAPLYPPPTTPRPAILVREAGGGIDLHEDVVVACLLDCGTLDIWTEVYYLGYV